MGWIPGFITGIFNPVKDLVDEFHFSGEEKGKLQTTLQTLESNVTLKVLELETRALEAQKAVLVAEATGNWMQRSWRPVLALSFGGIVVFNYILVGFHAFGVTQTPPPPIPDKMWVLLQIMIGGYVVGRSAEKVAKTMRKNA